MIKTKVATFSVSKKKPINYKPTKNGKKYIAYFSELMQENFSMSEELAKAIGTVVVQALTENAKDEQAALDDLGGDDELDLDMDLDESELPESARDAGEVQEAEGPKNAPDLSADFADLKSTISNHSNVQSFSDNRYKQVKQFLSGYSL